MQAQEVVQEGAAFDSVTLAYEDRHCRRIRLVTDGGVPFLLDLPEARVLREGDRLRLEDGRLVLVRAALEDLLEIRAADASALARLAWHLGNRHTPTQVAGEALRIRPDHVLEHLLRDHLGAEVRAIRAAFEPEGGAYHPDDH
jgi:urease accessory protein